MDIIINKELNRLRTIIEKNRVAFTDVANIQQQVLFRRTERINKR